MQKEYMIPPCSGTSVEMKKGQKISIIDVDGAQVADFFAVKADDPGEFFSAAVTVDCHESLKLEIDDFMYTNLYQPMFKVVADDVKRHDLLFPCCRPEMYDFFFQNGDGHPNCYDNINNALGEHRPIIQPLNVFMNTSVDENGKITIDPPISKAGDKLVLEALMDVRVGVASCSVEEGECNDKQCSSIKLVIED